MTLRIAAAALALALAGLGATDGGQEPLRFATGASMYVWRTASILSGVSYRCDDAGSFNSDPMCSTSYSTVVSQPATPAPPINFITPPPPRIHFVSRDDATETVDELRARVTALEARLADVERRVAAAEQRCRR